MATSLTTEQYHNGTGSQTNFAFTFPYLQQADVKVEHPIGTVLTAKTPSAANDYEFLTATTIKFTTAPASGTANVKIYRATEVDSAHAVFATGSSIRAQDLNSNFDQFLFSKQDKIDNRDITDEAIKNKHISRSAEIEVSKLKDGTARQVLQTDAAGTGVEWSSNIDIPGTLDVTGATNLDGTLEVAGATGINGDFNVNTNKFTVAASSGNTVIAGNLDVTGQFDVTGTSNYTGQQTVPGGALVKNIRVGLDAANEVSTTSGNLVLDSASGTVQVTDNADVDGNLNVDGNLVVDGTSTLTGNVSVGGTVDGRDVAADGTKLDGIEAGAKGDQTSTEIKALLASDNLTASHLAADSVGSSELANNSVGASHIAGDAVNGTHISDDVVDSEHYVDGSIDEQHIANDAVTYAKMQNVSATDRILGRDSSGAGIIEEITPANLRTMINVENGATADQTDAEIKTAYENNANTNALTDAEKLVIDGVTSTTAELNILDGVTADKDELNLLDGKSIVTTIAANATDSQLPTAQAVNERIDTLQDSFGGFVAISSRTTFPNTHPGPNNEADVVVSIADAIGIRVDSSGVATTANGQCTTVGGTAVKISGFPNTLRGGVSGNANPHVLGSGQGLQVVTTTTLNEYTYHKILANEDGVQNAQQAVDDFNNRYQVSANQPTTQPDGTALEEGDLWYNTNADKMQVFDTALSDYKDIVSVGNFDVLGLRNSANNGAAVYNNTQSQFTLVELDANGAVTGTAVSPEHAAQLVVSLFGIVQEAHEGTAIGSNVGYCINGNQIIFSQNLVAEPTFIHKIGTSTAIGVPGDNTVTSAKIVNGSIVDADVSNSAAIATSKISGAVTSIASHGLATSATTDTTNAANIGSGILPAARIADDSIAEVKLDVSNAPTNGQYLQAQSGGGGLTWSTPDKIEEGNSKVEVTDTGTGNVVVNTDGTNRLTITSNEVKTDTGSFIVENGSLNEGFYINDNSNNTMVSMHYSSSANQNGIYSPGRHLVLQGTMVSLQKPDGEYMLSATQDAEVELYYNGTKKLETTNTGVTLVDNLHLDNAVNAGKDCQWQPGSNRFTFWDDVKATFGDGVDLQIYHDGTNSIIDNNTNDLTIRCDGDDLKLLAEDDILLRDNDDSTNFIHCKNGGAVELFHNGTKKFETTSGGVATNGELTINGELNIDNGGDNNKYMDVRLGSGVFALRGTSGGDANHQTLANFARGGNCELFYNNNKKFETTSSGADVTGRLTTDGVFIGDGGDNDTSLSIGANNDLRLYHSGSHSYIKDRGTGDLFICSDDLHIGNAANTEDMAVFKENNAVELYYDNSKKFETTSGGVAVSGNALLYDGNKIQCGHVGDLEIFHDGTNSYIDSYTNNLIIRDLGGGHLQLRGDDVQILNQAGTETLANFIEDGAVELHHNNSKKFETVSGGAKVTGDLEVTGSLTGVTTGPTVMACWDNSGTYSTKMSSGVSSITDQATGESRINFSSNFTDVNYVAAGSHDGAHTNNGGDSRLPGFTVHNDKNVAYADLHFWNMHTNVNASYHAEYNDCFAAFWR